MRASSPGSGRSLMGDARCQSTQSWRLIASFISALCARAPIANRDKPQEQRTNLSSAPAPVSRRRPARPISGSGAAHTRRPLPAPAHLAGWLRLPACISGPAPLCARGEAGCLLGVRRSALDGRRSTAGGAARGAILGSHKIGSPLPLCLPARALVSIRLSRRGRLCLLALVLPQIRRHKRVVVDSQTSSRPAELQFTTWLPVDRPTGKRVRNLSVPAQPPGSLAEVTNRQFYMGSSEN